MTTAVVSSAAFPITSTTSMAKTPFIRNNSSSFEDEEETGDHEQNNDDEKKKDSGGSSSGADFSVTPVQVQQVAQVSAGQSPAKLRIEESKIHITKKMVQAPPQSNSLSVVNKMSQSVYSDHQNPCPPKGLKRYKILSLVGDGTYGLVYMATNVETREKVAIKAMKRKYHSWDEVMDLREVKSLKKLHHPNVVKLKEVIRENSRLYFVFEYVKGDLLGLMREKAEPFPEFWIRSVIQQVLQGLAYMHRLGFFHRDLKPENILATGPDVVKIADFGLVREIRSSPPYTDYVSTRWYRAPEVLLRSTNYNSPIDIWAVGCITSELYTKRPLFPGTSEIDQLYKVASILGTPGRNDWPDGYSLANSMSFRFPAFQSTHLSQILGNRTSSRAVSFLYALLAWNPSWRSSAQEALKHSYFRMSQNNANNGKPDNSQLQGLLNSDENSYGSNGSSKTDSDIPPSKSSMLSLSLRPRNNVDKDNNMPVPAVNSMAHERLPLQMTAIEPHYSRDTKKSEKIADVFYGSIKKDEKPKTPPQPTPQPLQPHEELKDEDLNDLISAFSLEASAGHKNRLGNNTRSKFVILSPTKTRLAKIETLAGSPSSPRFKCSTLRMPKRALPQPHPKLTPQRTFQLQNAYNTNGALNFSPTTTKFTLLYGHHQPTTFKIVSPAKLGLDSNSNSTTKHSDSNDSKSRIEEIMGKRITGIGNGKFFPGNHSTNNQASPVNFRSLPDFSTSKKPTTLSNHTNNLTPNKRRTFAFPAAPDPAINVNGKGLGDSPEKTRIQVRPDWAAKYLK